MSASTDNVVGNVGPVTNIHKVKSAATTNAAVVRGGPGRVKGYSLYNGAAYAVFVKLYNQVAAPTVGTDVPAMTIGIAAGASRDVSIEADFDTGIAIAITKLVAEDDTTAVAADDLTGAILYS